MKYLLRQLRSNLETEPEVEIGESDYEAYKEAKKVLENCLSIEEKYDIVISNFIDLESEVFNLAESYLIRGYNGYTTLFNIRLRLNRCYVNLLSSARSYIDQIGRHVDECLPYHSDSESTVRDFFTEEYDRKLEYRILYHLRNHVQHFGLPIHWTSLNNRLRQPSDVHMVETSLQFAIFKSELDLNPKYPRRILEEMNDQMDLKQTTNRFMESLRRVHLKVRDLISDSVVESRSRIEQTLQSFSNEQDTDTVYLEAVKIDEEMEESEVVLLMLEWDDQRLELQKKNKSNRNFEKSYVTNRSTEES